MKPGKPLRSSLPLAERIKAQDRTVQRLEASLVPMMQREESQTGEPGAALPSPAARLGIAVREGELAKARDALRRLQYKARRMELRAAQVDAFDVEHPAPKRIRGRRNKRAAGARSRDGSVRAAWPEGEGNA